MPAESPGPAWSDLRRWLEADARALVEAARSAPRSPVPTCPGWVARDVVDHTAEVYAHKVAAIRLGRRPQEGEWPWAPDDDTVFGWFDDRLVELLAVLDEHDPADPAWTWFAADQSVGFWLRRMAHETAIHRVDAQVAAGVPVGAHDEALAADGVAEVLGPFAGNPDVRTASTADDGAAGRVLVVAGAQAWLVDLPDGGYDVRDTPLGGAAGDAAVASVRGSAGDVYRWLWNRPPDAPVEATGAAEVLRRLRARLLVATQ
jgi:uncharacterized protein (TIGR03083 family)